MALVITVVVLLILAGASISLVSGDIGILNKASKATQKTKKESLREELELESTNWIIEVKNGINEIDAFNNLCVSIENKEYSVKKNEDNTLKVSKDNYSFYIKDGVVSDYSLAMQVHYNEIAIGSYVNYGINYDNVKTWNDAENTRASKKGWIVMGLYNNGTENDLTDDEVKLLCNGTPISYYHATNSDESLMALNNNFYNTTFSVDDGEVTGSKFYNEYSDNVKSLDKAEYDQIGLELLINGSYFWLGTKMDSTNLYFFHDGAKTTNSRSNRICGVRPVVFLKSNIECVGGDGTENNPYEINLF